MMTSRHHHLPSRRRYELADSGEPIDETHFPSAWERWQDYLMATFAGQFLLRKASEVLRVAEQTTKWRCTVKEGAPQPKLVRPLPWILFLPSLLILRLGHISLQTLYRIRGYPAPSAEEIVRNLQRWQRQVRRLRYVGMRVMRYQGPGVLTKLRDKLLNVLSNVFGWFGLVVLLKSTQIALQEHQTTQTNRPHVKRHKVNDKDEMAQNDLVDDSLHDLLYKEYPDTDSDATFVVDTSSEMESSAYQSLSDTDHSNEPCSEKSSRKQRMRAKCTENPDQSMCLLADTPKATAQIRTRKHIPNESSSGVESMDTRAPPPTAEHSLSSVKSDEEDDEMFNELCHPERSESKQGGGATPLHKYTVIHPGTPDTPTITVCDYDEQFEADTSLMMNVSSILAETVTLRSIENHSAPVISKASISDPSEMSKSKRRRLKKKLLHQQNENKEN